MNNLLDFAGLLLYYIVLPFLIPIQGLLYALAGVWFVFVFCNRLVLDVPRLFSWLRLTASKAHVPAWRRKLVKVPA